MKKKYELIIFDLAGTLVDPGSIAPLIAFSRAFKDKGYDVSDSVIRKFMGTNKRDHIRLILEDIQADVKDKTIDIERIYGSFKEHIPAAISETSRPIKGVPQVIKKLQNLGYRIAVTTGYSKQQSLLVYNAAAQLSSPHWHVPRPIICSNDVNRGRPYPYMCFRAMEYYNVSSVDKCIKVGDTIADLQAAKNAGMDCVGVLSGATTKKEFEKNNFYSIRSVANWFEYFSNEVA